jgi:hypothetical protein
MLTINDLFFSKFYNDIKDARMMMGLVSNLQNIRWIHPKSVVCIIYGGFNRSWKLWELFSCFGQ